MAGIKDDYCERTRGSRRLRRSGLCGRRPSSFRLAKLHPDERRQHHQQARESQDIPKWFHLLSPDDDFFPYLSRESKDVIHCLTTNDNELPCPRHAQAMPPRLQRLRVVPVDVSLLQRALVVPLCRWFVKSYARCSMHRARN